MQHLWRNLKNITHNAHWNAKINSYPTTWLPWTSIHICSKEREWWCRSFSKSKLERKSLNLRKKQKSATHVPPTRLSPQCPIQGLRWQWVPMSLQIEVLPALPLSVAASQLSPVLFHISRHSNIHVNTHSWLFYHFTPALLPLLSLSHARSFNLSLFLSLSSNTFYIDGDTAKRTNTAKASTCLAKPFCQESLHKGSRPYCMSAKIYHHCLQTLNNHHHQCKQNLNNVWKIYKYILGHKWDLAAAQPIFEQIGHWCHIAVVWLKDNSWKQPNAGKGVLVKTWKHDASINPKSAMASHADVPTGIFLPLELKTMINTKVWEQLRSSNTIGLPSH